MRSVRTVRSISAAAEDSRARFESGVYYCAESVLLAIAAYQGIESDVLLPVATGFCSGVARTRGMCGAVSGAVMGLGLINGRRAPGDDRTPNYDAVRAFLAAFDARYGAINCYDLTGCDLGTAEGQQRFRDTNMMARCAEFVEQATRLALEAVPDEST